MAQFPKSFIPDEDEEDQSVPKSFIPDEEEEIKSSAFSRIKSALLPGDKLDVTKAIPAQAKQFLTEHPNFNLKRKLDKFLADVIVGEKDDENKSTHPYLRRHIISQDPGWESVLPNTEEIGIKHEPDTYLGGFTKGLYNEWARPIASAAGIGGFIGGGEAPEVGVPDGLPIREPIHRNFTKSTPQQDAVAIALTREGVPRTASEISLETNIPKASIRRSMSDLRKRGVISEDEKTANYLESNKPSRFNRIAQENIAENKRTPEQQRMDQDPSMFAGESIRQPEVTPRDFGYNERDSSGVRPVTQVEDLSIRQLKAATQTSKELPIRQSREIPYRTQGDLPSEVQVRELSIRQPKEAINRADVPREFALLEDEAVNAQPEKSSVKNSEDILYDIARNKQKMGLDLPTESKIQTLRENRIKTIFDKESAKESIKKSEFVNPFEKKTEEINKANVPREFVLPEDEAVHNAQSSTKEVRNSDDILYDIARNKQKMGLEPPEVKPDEDIQFMKVPIKGQERPNIAMGGADPKVLDVIGTALYTKPRPLVTVKELLQNSFDEHRIIGQTEPIHVVVNRHIDIPGTKDKGSAIIVKDAGRGMTSEELYTIFTDVGKTGKTGEESASGGFGFAKAAPMLSGKYVQVESIVSEKGQKVKYSFEGNPSQMKDQIKGNKLNREILDPNEKTGLIVKTYFDNDTSAYGVSNYVKNVTENSPSITSPVHIAESYNSELTKEYLKGKNRTASTDKYMETRLKEMQDAVTVHTAKSPQPIQDKISIPGADIDIHYENKPNATTDRYNLHFLNKGMYQDTGAGYYGSNMDGVPKNIVANIRATVEEGMDDYPFGANREQISTKVSRAISEWVNKNIVSGAQEKKKNKLIDLYNSLADFPNLPGMIRKGVIFDAGERLNFKEKATFYTNPTVQNVTKHFDQMLEDIVSVVDSSYENNERANKLEATGLLLSDESTLGIYIPNPKTRGAKSTILINWLQPIATKNPYDAALTSTITALHEAAHISSAKAIGFSLKDLKGMDDPRIGKFLTEFLKELDDQGGLNANHDMDFIKRLGEIFTQYGPSETLDAAERLHGLITDGTGKYSSDVQKLLHIYQESRGRAEVTEDFLSSMGIKSETPRGGKKNTPSDDKSDGKGASSAVDKLFNSMGKIKENRVQQDIINKTERVRRFAAFKDVEDVGVSGAAKSLSKLKGEFGKIELEKLRMTQPQADSLFTAVKRAKITEGEKARGYTALFKLLNGEELPQSNELRILDDVFGNGFASRIVEMHGGIGAVNLKLAKTANTMKAMMSSTDLSFPLKQGIGFIHKSEWRNAVREQLKYFAKPEYFKAAMESIEDRPKYLLGRESGLFLAKPGGLINGEEAFMNNYVGDIPKGIKGLYIQDIVDASERSYIGGLNKLRSDLFDNLTELAEKTGNEVFVKKQLRDAKGNYILDNNGNVQTIKIPTKIAEDIANYINVFTGRGKLGKLEPIATTLNTYFWSPRLLSSRLTALNPKFYMDLDPFTRKEAIKSAFAVAGASTIINTLGTLAGATVSYNILSSDFMKSRFNSGNVLDPNGGFQQPIVLAARILNEVSRMGHGKKRAYNEKSIPELIWNFATNKLSPMAGLGYDLASTKQFSSGGNYIDRFGTNKNIATETTKRFVSIFSQDMYNVMMSDPSFAEAIGLPPLMLLGAGEQNYPERKQKPSVFKKLRP
jgi:hypothetical protein